MHLKLCECIVLIECAYVFKSLLESVEKFDVPYVTFSA